MKQLNWYQIFGQTHTIPDGSTVTPTDDVQILLNCANIWDKAYTTIADLLSDTASLSAVIADNNAINYLVRSTTFASSMTADATAMTDIGGNNYASNTLLGDSTWCTAICNSVYFESVLNVKVPTMTSNTTPEGLCFLTGQSSYDSGSEPWKAFDGNDSTNAIMRTTTGSGYYGYRFTAPVRVLKVRIVAANTSESILSAKNADDLDWTSLHNFNWSTENQEAVISNSNSYLEYRLLIKPTSSSTYAYLRTLQFYGRRDI